MSVTLVEAAAPCVVDAQRAAAALVASGAEEVFLFGSVARGEATQRSDIDLLALFADIDYGGRYKLRRELEAAAAAAAVGGRWPVQVVVTDRPEWKARIEQVRSSFEYRINCSQMILVGDSGCRSQVRWGKQMDRPMSDLQEAWTNFDSQIMSKLISLQRDTVPGRVESHSYYTASEQEDARLFRMVEVCACSAMVVELAIKNLALWHSDPVLASGALREAGHNIAACLNLLPASVRLEVEDCFLALDLDLDTMSSWRVDATYVDDKRPLQSIADELADRYVMAALETAAVLFSDLAVASNPRDETLRRVRHTWQGITAFMAEQDVRSGFSARAPRVRPGANCQPCANANPGSLSETTAKSTQARTSCCGDIAVGGSRRTGCCSCGRSRRARQWFGWSRLARD